MRILPISEVSPPSEGAPDPIESHPIAIVPNDPTPAVAGASTRREGMLAPTVVEHFMRQRGAMGEELPGFEQWLLREHGVPLEDNLDAKGKLIALFTDNPDDMLKAGLRLLEKADDQNPVSVATAVRTAKEVLYSAIGKEVRDAAGSRFNVVGVLGVARRALAPTTYMLQYDDPNEVIGARRAKLEARNLVDPNDPARFVSDAELAALTPAQVASLDIPESHPMWHTEAHRREHPDAYAEMERWLDRAVTAELKKDGLDVEYRFREASKVVFLDKIRESATSPKVKVEDAYGQNLGLKWGEECAVEPVVNRLLLKLGQKFCDIADNRVGADSPKLVLPEGVTVEQLTDSLKRSSFDFNLKPHIQSATVVTAENVDQLLAELPPNGKHRKQDLIGRTVVTFKESMIEAKHGVFGRSGPVPLHNSGAIADRVRRGMQLAYLWVLLTDNKEDNHRYAFPKHFEGEKGRSVVAFMHDTGSALGGTGRTGMLNELRVDERFLKRNLLGNLVSSEFQLYRSAAWDHETMGDLLWMAKKICSLSQRDIAECAEASAWPDFMKEVLVYRLAKRRDMIAEHFGLSTGDPVGDAPTIEVRLATRAEREAAAARYGLDVEAIEGAMRDADLLDRNYTDVLVKDGKISNGGDTVLIGLLRDAYYPTGLDHRTNRREDGQEYQPLRYGDW